MRKNTPFNYPIEQYMSSWANRHLPRKRDLSQIPAELRPQIVPRAEQPLVILSETFQPKPVNEVIYPDEPAPLFSLFRTGESFPQMEPSPSSAVSLSYHGLSYVFVILRNIRYTKDNELWMSSYRSIRRFYTNPIKIIDDNSSINTVNGKLVDTEVIQSEWNGAGEILPYYYFLKNEWADRMIFIHDSMFLYRPFHDDELSDPVRFHWYFDNKKDQRSYITYLSILSNSNPLIEYSTDTTVWKGCFGATSMIDLDLVKKLEEKYGLFSRLTMSIRTRPDREQFERIFGMILFYEGYVTESRCSNFGNIFDYPLAFESNYQTINEASDMIKQKNYQTAIVKVWRGR